MNKQKKGGGIVTVGECIRELRKFQGLTQKELGEKSNTSEITIRQYELGKRQPRLEQLKKIASVLGVSVDALIGVPSPLQPGEMQATILESIGGERGKIEIILDINEKGLTDEELKERLVSIYIDLVDIKEKFGVQLKGLEDIKAKIDHLEELTEIPKYQRSPVATPPDASQPSQPKDPAPEKNPAEDEKNAPGDA